MYNQRMTEPTKCECGGKYARPWGKAKHMKSNKHQRWLGLPCKELVNRKERFECGCGGRYTYGDKTQHESGRKHRVWAGLPCEPKPPPCESGTGAIAQLSAVEPFIKCECGSHYQPHNKRQHAKTRNHRKWVESQQQQQQQQQPREPETV